MPEMSEEVTQSSIENSGEISTNSLELFEQYFPIFLMAFEEYKAGRIEIKQLREFFPWVEIQNRLFAAISELGIEDKDVIAQLRHNIVGPIGRVYSSMALLAEDNVESNKALLDVIEGALSQIQTFLKELEEYDPNNLEIDMYAYLLSLKDTYSRGVKFNFNLHGIEEGQKVSTMHSATMLKQQIRELVINSIKHKKPNVELEINITVSIMANSYLVVRVKDNGKGTDRDRVRDYNNKAAKGQDIGPENGSSDTHGQGAAAMARSGTKTRLGRAAGGGAIQMIQIPLSPDSGHIVGSINSIVEI